MAQSRMWRGDWRPVQRIMQAAREPLLLESERLHGLLQRSNALLTPLADPLLTDFGVHQWLAKAREEVYSNCLKWIVEQLATPEYVFRLFGIADPAGIALCQQTSVTVEREVPVPQGHDGHSGKLDLVVCYEGKALLVVEVKKADADGADTLKHGGYMQWIRAQPEPEEHKHSILLVVEATQENYAGFASRRWSHLCVVLRQIAQTLCKEPQRIVLAAMILAFVGAVEQNLLAFSAPLLQRLYSGQSVRVSSEIGNHIEASFEEEVAYGH